MLFPGWTEDPGGIGNRILERLLELPGEIAKRYQRRVVLILDQFPEVLEIDRHLPAVMRSICQLQDVSHVFVGSKRHVMARLFGDREEPFYRAGTFLPLDPFPAPFAGMLRDRFEATGIRVEDGATELILSRSGGYHSATLGLANIV